MQLKSITITETCEDCGDEHEVHLLVRADMHPDPSTPTFLEDGTIPGVVAEIIDRRFGKVIFDLFNAADPEIPNLDDGDDHGRTH